MEIYFSIDVESDGPIPFHNSMLSLGCAAYLPSGTLVGTYSANVQALLEAEPDKETMKWWATQPEAWKACHENSRPAANVMPEFCEWVRKLSAEHKSKPVMVAYPAGYDWTWIYCYMMAFSPPSPFGFQCIDMKSFAMAKLGTEFKNTSKKMFPRHWFNDCGKHSHVALEDALEQGRIFLNMLHHKVE